MITGAGMGLRFAGPTADAAFWSSAERTWGANAEAQKAHGIRLYTRFRDDMFIIGTCRAGTRKFITGLKARSRNFKIVVEEVSHHSVSFLEVKITKSMTRFSVQPRLKAEFGVPLCHTSAHPPFVHNWPYNMVQRLRCLSTTLREAGTARSALVSRFASQLIPQWRLNAMMWAALALRTRAVRWVA